MQREAAVVMAFFGRRANAMTKLNAVTGVQAFGVADKGLPAAQVNRTITGAQALAEDETDNPAALVFGFQKER